MTKTDLMLTDEEGEPIDNVLDYLEGWYDAEKGLQQDTNRGEDYYRAYEKYHTWEATLGGLSRTCH